MWSRSAVERARLAGHPPARWARDSAFSDSHANRPQSCVGAQPSFDAEVTAPPLASVGSIVPH